MLQIGLPAPAFSLLNQDGQTVTLESLKGKWMVIYFYPKDDTPGCTKEACMIAEIYKDFETIGVQVCGVSKDTPKSHKKFAEKYHLPFALLSDPGTEMIQAYAAWREKSMFGKKYMGIDRITYIINPAGTVVKTYEKVDPASHALQILTDLKILQNS